MKGNMGKIFKFENGAEIHVLGDSDKKGYYKTVCKTCAERDPEVWGFIADRKMSGMKAGYSACGCSKRPTYRHVQLAALVYRVNAMGKFSKIPLTNIKGMSHWFKTTCTKHLIDVETDLFSILKGKKGCKLCSNSAIAESRGSGKVLVCGVGINDADYAINIWETVDGMRIHTWMCPYYRTWNGLLNRCYNPKSNTYYKDVYVCEEWLRFSTFKSWMEKQDWEGKHLDKDVYCVAHGISNKVYSPETCMFIPPKLNSFFTKHKNEAFITGANWDKSAGKYLAKGYRDRKYYYLGRYDNQLDAHKAWQKWKVGVLVEIVNDINDGTLKENLQKCVERLRDEIARNVTTNWL